MATLSLLFGLKLTSFLLKLVFFFKQSAPLLLIHRESPWDFTVSLFSVPQVVYLGNRDGCSCSGLYCRDGMWFQVRKLFWRWCVFKCKISAAITVGLWCCFHGFSPSRYPTQPCRFGKLLLLLPALRSISPSTIEEVFFKKTIGNVPITRLLSDMYKSSDI
jgi:hypothetical protein